MFGFSYVPHQEGNRFECLGCMANDRRKRQLLMVKAFCGLVLFAVAFVFGYKYGAIMGMP